MTKASQQERGPKGQGCKSVSSIGGDDQHILVTFLILGVGMILRFLS